MDKNNFIVVKPRYSDFNLQGTLRVGVYPELICECHLHLIENVFGLPMKIYTDRGERWRITEYFIRVTRPVKAFEQIAVEGTLIGVRESRLRMRFRFLSQNRRNVLAEGYICFDLVDDKTDQPKAIPKQEREILEKHVDETEV